MMRNYLFFSAFLVLAGGVVRQTIITKDSQGLKLQEINVYVDSKLVGITDAKG